MNNLGMNGTKNHVCGLVINSKVCMYETGMFSPGTGSAHYALFNHVQKDHHMRISLFCNDNCKHVKLEGQMGMGDTFKPYYDRQHHCVYGACQFIARNHQEIKNHYSLAHAAAGAGIQPYCKQDCIFLVPAVVDAVDFSGDV